MKKICAVIITLVMVLTLSPCAFAAVTLEKPSSGQLIFCDADNYESYTADFYLSALSYIQRVDNDLELGFSNARIVLRDFFATRDSMRSIRFLDGSSVSADDFDENGTYTGEYYDGYISDLSSTPKEMNFDYEDDETYIIYSKSSTGTTMKYSDGQSVLGEQRAEVTSLADEYIALAGGEVDGTLELKFSVADDGSLSLDKETLTNGDGLTVVITRPDIVYMPDAFNLLPVSKGRTSVSFTNSLGNELQRLNIRVTDDNGTLAVICNCPACGEDQGSTLHLAPCGHYRCSDDYDESTHGIPECGIAGHCTTDGQTHSICTNCRKYQCNGEAHGGGICEHVHNWTQKSYTAPTASSNGESVAVCTTCGAEYTQVLPMTGAAQ